jgi:RHS repeat-associated protein
VNYVADTSYDNVARLVGRSMQGPSATPAAQWLYRNYEFGTSTGRLQLMNATVGTSTGAVTVQNDDYAYDNDSNIVRIEHDTPDFAAAGYTGIQRECFTYDAQSRLTRSWTRDADFGCDLTSPNPDNEGPAPYDLSYEFAGTNGKIGNMTAMVDNKTSVTTPYTYPSSGAGSVRPHAPTAVGSKSYVWDANGMSDTRNIGAGVEDFSYDAQLRLRSFTKGGQTATFTYGPDGERILRKEPVAGGGTKTTLYLPGQELSTTGAANAETTRYYAAGGATIALRKPDGTLHWMLGNHQGTVSYTILQGTSNVTIQRNLPYGAARGPANQLPTDRGFVGQTEDDYAGLSFLNARYYDTTISKFLGPDPLADSADPQSLNKYSYSGNNPTTFSDPTGLLRDENPQGCGECSSTRTRTRIRVEIVVDPDGHAGQLGVDQIVQEQQCAGSRRQTCRWVDDEHNVTWLSPDESVELAKEMVRQDLDGIRGEIDTAHEGGEEDGNLSEDDFSDYVDAETDDVKRLVGELLLESGGWEEFWTDRPWNRDVVDWGARNRGTIATIGAIAVCASALATGFCGVAVAGAFAVRAHQRCSGGPCGQANLADGLITGATFMLFTVPMGQATKGYRAAGQSGLAVGSQAASTYVDIVVLAGCQASDAGVCSSGG